MHRNNFADWDGPSGGVRGPPIGYIKVPKMTFLGHKRVLWLQSGETVGNKGRTSQDTSGVVLCNSFVGQRRPSRGIKDKAAVASIVVFSTIFAGNNDKYSGVLYYICRKYYKKDQIIVQKKVLYSKKR